MKVTAKAMREIVAGTPQAGIRITGEAGRIEVEVWQPGNGPQIDRGITRAKYVIESKSDCKEFFSAICAVCEVASDA